MMLWFYQVSFLIIQVHAATYEKNLTTFLLSDYSPLIRPVKNPKDKVTVTVGIELINIENVNEKQQYITNKIWLRTRWINELMTWEPKSWDNIKKLKLNPELIWYPDLTLFNEISDDLSAGTSKCRTQIVAEFDGLHRWSCPIIYKCTCMINVQDFPLDMQDCYMKFGSWNFDQTKLDFLEDDKPIITRENYVNSSEWDLLKVDKEVNSKAYKCCQHNFTDITFRFILSRKPLFYILNITSPCIILMALILSSFFLPPNSGERISLIITVLLAFAIFMQLMSSYLPRNSNATPALSIFYITIIAESAYSFVATCFVLIIYYKGTEKGSKPPPHWVRKYILSKMKNWEPESMNLKVLYTDENRNGGESQYLLASENKERKLRKDNDDDVIPSSEEVEKSGVLLSEVKKINSVVKKQSKQDDIEEEWHLFAKAFDRFFFVLFFILYAVSTFSILIPVFLKNR